MDNLNLRTELRPIPSSQEKCRKEDRGKGRLSIIDWIAEVDKAVGIPWVDQNGRKRCPLAVRPDDGPVFCKAKGGSPHLSNLCIDSAVYAPPEKSSK